jgi:hypothetical protein
MDKHSSKNECLELGRRFGKSAPFNNFSRIFGSNNEKRSLIVITGKVFNLVTISSNDDDAGWQSWQSTDISIRRTMDVTATAVMVVW